MEAEVKTVVGSENLLSGSETARFSVSGVQPAVVAFPGNRDEVSALVLLARERGWSVAAYGGGTQIHTGFPPSRLDLVLSTQRLDRVVDYQPDDMTITVDSGITLATLQNTLDTRRQLLPLNPPLPDRATAGGTVAAAVVGPWSAGYGGPRDWLIGCRVVGADGQEVRGGGQVVKNVAGYDLPKLYTGSHGTLGVLTELTFKVMPAPAARAYCRIFLSRPDVEQLLAAVRDSDLMPASIELVHTTLWQSVAHSVADRSWALFIEFHHVPDALDWQLEHVAELARAVHAVSDTLPAVAGEALLAAIRDRPARHSLTARLSVVSSQVADTAGALEHWCTKRGLPPLVLSHAAVGQVFVCADGDLTSADLEAVREIALARGGTCRFQRLPDALTSAVDPWGEAGPQVRLMQGIKSTLDPTGLFSPGRFVARI